MRKNQQKKRKHVVVLNVATKDIVMNDKIEAGEKWRSYLSRPKRFGIIVMIWLH